MSDASAEFAAERPRLLGLAYRMLGTVSDAEDVVQEAWLRWNRADPATVERPVAWLTTVTTRLALDRVRTLKRRREDYVGPWLPEPVAVQRTPEAAAEVADSLTLGFLVVLDRLNPQERAVFLLAEVFGEPYAAVAAAVGKTENNCRQIARRARRKVRDQRPPEVSPATMETLGRMVNAVLDADVDGLLALMDADVTLVSDGGANRTAARRPVVGRDRVARFVLNIGTRAAGAPAEFVELNGAPALRIDLPEGPVVLSADEREGRIVALRAVLNPDKLNSVGTLIVLQ